MKRVIAFVCLVVAFSACKSTSDGGASVKDLDASQGQKDPNYNPDGTTQNQTSPSDNPYAGLPDPVQNGNADGGAPASSALTKVFLDQQTAKAIGQQVRKYGALSSQGGDSMVYKMTILSLNWGSSWTNNCALTYTEKAGVVENKADCWAFMAVLWKYGRWVNDSDGKNGYGDAAELGWAKSALDGSENAWVVKLNKPLTPQ